MVHLLHVINSFRNAINCSTPHLESTVRLQLVKLRMIGQPHRTQCLRHGEVERLMQILITLDSMYTTASTRPPTAIDSPVPFSQLASEPRRLLSSSITYR